MAMNRRITAWAAGLALALAGTPAHALDDQALDRWIATMEELRSYDEAHDLESDLESEHQDLDPADPDFEAMFRESAEQHDAVSGIIRDQGYDSVGEWASDGDRVIRALMALEQQDQPDMRAEMEEALREIEESPHMSDEQKAMMREQMEAQMETFSGFFDDVPESDIRAVERRRDDLDRVLD